jgi:hypothetical protein
VEEIEAKALHVYATDSGLQISGLVSGELLSIYNMQGQLFYKGKATATEECIKLRERGIYIVVAGSRRVKAIY